MRDVTGEEVKAAMVAEKIYRVYHHNCSICGYQTAYIFDKDQLFFDAGCHCTWGGWRPSSFESAAAWINMQTQDQWKAEIASRFGVKLENKHGL